MGKESNVLNLLFKIEGKDLKLAFHFLLFLYRNGRAIGQYWNTCHSIPKEIGIDRESAGLGEETGSDNDIRYVELINAIDHFECLRKISVILASNDRQI